VTDKKVNPIIQAIPCKHSKRLCEHYEAETGRCLTDADRRLARVIYRHGGSIHWLPSWAEVLNYKEQAIAGNWEDVWAWLNFVQDLPDHRMVEEHGYSPNDPLALSGTAERARDLLAAARKIDSSTKNFIPVYS